MGINCPPDKELTVAAAGGVAIHCRCFGGNGEPLVLLHGNGEDYHCFDQQLKPFSAKYRVVAIDSRGHGSSEMGDPFSLRAMADDVKAVLDALHIERASVIGFSDGGNVALYFAMCYPSRLNRLVVAGANLFPEGLARKQRRKDAFLFGMLQFFGRFSPQARHKARVYGLMIDEPQIDPWELETIDAPVLVLAGERDLILPEHTKLIAESIPNAYLRIIPASNHFIFRNQPDWVNTTILKFLAQA